MSVLLFIFSKNPSATRSKRKLSRHGTSTVSTQNVIGCIVCNLNQFRCCVVPLQWQDSTTCETVKLFDLNSCKCCTIFKKYIFEQYIYPSEISLCHSVKGINSPLVHWASPIFLCSPNCILHSSLTSGHRIFLTLHIYLSGVQTGTITAKKNICSVCLA